MASITYGGKTYKNTEPTSAVSKEPVSGSITYGGKTYTADTGSAAEATEKAPETFAFDGAFNPTRDVPTAYDSLLGGFVPNSFNNALVDRAKELNDQYWAARTGSARTETGEIITSKKQLVDEVQRKSEESSEAAKHAMTTSADLRQEKKTLEQQNRDMSTPAMEYQLIQSGKTAAQQQAENNARILEIDKQLDYYHDNFGVKNNKEKAEDFLEALDAQHEYFMPLLTSKAGLLLDSGINELGKLFTGGKDVIDTNAEKREIALLEAERAAAIEAAKEQHNNFGKNLIDATLAADQMLGDTAMFYASGVPNAMGYLAPSVAAAQNASAAATTLNPTLAQKAANFGTKSLGALGGAVLNGGTNAGISASAGLNAFTEAQLSGASFDQSVSIGVQKGLLEYFSNKLFGGNPLEDVGLDTGYVTIAAKKIADKLGAADALGAVMNSTGGKVASYFMDKAGEGLEEVISGIGEPIIDALNYMDASKLPQFDEWVDQLGDEFVVGFLMSLMFSAPGDTAKAVKSGVAAARDFATQKSVEKYMDSVESKLQKADSGEFNSQKEGYAAMDDPEYLERLANPDYKMPEAKTEQQKINNVLAQMSQDRELQSTSNNDNIDIALSDNVQRAVDMYKSGATPSEIFNETRLFLLANGNLYDQATDTVVWRNDNGRRTDDGRGDQEGVQDFVSERDGGGNYGITAKTPDRTYDALNETERARVADAIEEEVNNAQKVDAVEFIQQIQQKAGISEREAIEQIAQRIYDDYVEGRVVAEQRWTSTFGNLSELFAAFDAAVSEKESGAGISADEYGDRFKADAEQGLHRENYTESELAQDEYWRGEIEKLEAEKASLERTNADEADSGAIGVRPEVMNRISEIDNEIAKIIGFINDLSEKVESRTTAAEESYEDDMLGQGADSSLDLYNDLEYRRYARLTKFKENLEKEKELLLQKELDERGLTQEDLDRIAEIDRRIGVFDDYLKKLRDEVTERVNSEGWVKGEQLGIERPVGTSNLAFENERDVTTRRYSEEEMILLAKKDFKFDEAGRITNFDEVVGNLVAKDNFTAEDERKAYELIDIAAERGDRFTTNLLIDMWLQSGSKTGAQLAHRANMMQSNSALRAINDINRLVDQLATALRNTGKEKNIAIADKFTKERMLEFRNEVLDIHEAFVNRHDGVLRERIRQTAKERGLYGKEGGIRQKRVEKALESLSGGSLYDIALTTTIGKLMDMIPSEATKKINAWQTIAMLFNAPTIERNILTNGFVARLGIVLDNIAVPIDAMEAAALSLWLDRTLANTRRYRTIGFENPLLASGKGAKTARQEEVNKSIVRVAFDSPSGEMSKYGQRGYRTFKKGSGNNVFSRGFNTGMSAIEELLGYGLNSTDAAESGSISGVIQESLYRVSGNKEIERLNARLEEIADEQQRNALEGKTDHELIREWDDIKARIRELEKSRLNYVAETQMDDGRTAARPLTEKIADRDAKKDTFHGNTLLGKAMIQLHDILNTNWLEYTALGKKVDPKRYVEGKSIKIGGKEFHQFNHGLGDWATKFGSFAGKSATWIAEYTPLGWLKEIYNIAELVDANRAIMADHGEDITNYSYSEMTQYEKAVMAQRDTAKQLVRPLGYYGLVSVMKLLVQAGIVSVDDDDDKDTARDLKNRGRSGAQINVSQLGRLLRGEAGDDVSMDGDDYVSMANMLLLNGVAKTAAKWAELDEMDDAEFFDYMTAPIGAAADAFKDLPIMQPLNTIVQDVKYRDKKDAEGNDLSGSEIFMNTAGNILTDELSNSLLGYIPTPVKKLAQGTDPYQRDTSADTNFGRLGNQFKNSLPGLRNTLPVKLDSRGEEMESSIDDKAMRLINSMFSPYNVTSYTESQLDKYLEDLGVFPTYKAPNYYDINGKRYTLDTESKREWQQVYGETFDNAAGMFQSGENLNELGEDRQNEILRYIKSYSNAVAKQNYLAGNGETYELSGTSRNVEKALEANEESGIELANWYLAYDEHKAIDDQKGVSAAAKAEQFAQWLDNQPWVTAKQKATLKDQMTFTSYLSYGDEPLTSDKLRAFGISNDASYTVSNGMREFNKDYSASHDGKDAPEWEKDRYLMSLNMSDEDTLKSIKYYASDVKPKSGGMSMQEKIQYAYDEGKTLDDIVTFRQFKSEFTTKKERAMNYNKYFDMDTYLYFEELFG